MDTICIREQICIYANFAHVCEGIIYEGHLKNSDNRVLFRKRDKKLSASIYIQIHQ